MSTAISVSELTDRDRFVSRLTDAGFSLSEADAVLKQSDSIDLSPESAAQFQSYFRNKDDGRVDIAKVDAYMHIQDVKMTVDTYIPVLNDRADNVDNETAIEDMRMVVKMLHASGCNGQEIADLFNEMVKISKADTPHPTEHHSPEGIKLDRAIVEAAESPHYQRDAALKNALQNMIDSGGLAATKKSNMVDEIDNSCENARIHNAGVNIMDRDLERLIFEETGENTDVYTHTTPVSWVVDSDGKPNAEGFAMLAAISTTKYNAMLDISVNIGKALDGKLSTKARADLIDLKGKIDQVAANLQPVYEQSRDICRQLAQAEPRERETLYQKFYREDYKKLEGKLANAYVQSDKTRGVDLYNKTVDTLDKYRKSIEDQNPEGALCLDESCRTARRSGFALFKPQPRQSDLVDIRMLDNYFSSDEFLGLGILNDVDREELQQKGRFSKLDKSTQDEHWKKTLKFSRENGNRKDLVNILASANPLTFKPVNEGGIGYPNQERSHIDRMRILSFFPYTLAEGIISDAMPFAAPRQKFFADIMGIPHMKHMALNEDPENLKRQNTLVRQWSEHGGADNMVSRREKNHAFFKRLHQTLHVMRPASDAERNGGSFTRLQAIDQYRQIVREGYDMGIPIEIMIGGGGSLNRFGGDVDMVRRVAAQELKDIFKEKKERGENFSDVDSKVLLMASTIMYTEQGANTYKTDKNGKPTNDLLLDSYTENAGAQHLLGYQNNGARPAAGKVSGAAKKKTSGLRAIGKDQTLYTMQSFHCGFYAGGKAMQRIHSALKDEKIKGADVDDLMHNADWNEAIFSRNLIDAGRFNALHLFQKISNDEKEWGFDRAVSIGRETVWQKDLESGKNILRYYGDDDVTQEEMYLSKIYYDRALFLAMTEAALTPKGRGATMESDVSDILKQIRPKDNSLDFGMGARTQEKWPSVSAETLADHQKNAPAYALYNMVNDDISEQLNKGVPHDDIMAPYGDGDPKKAHTRFRAYGSALRAGTMPHKGKWMGTDTYGIENRASIDMRHVLEQMAPNSDETNLTMQ